MARQQSMLLTAEARWIFRGDVPEDVVAWLRGSDLSPHNKPLQALLDRYVWTGRDDLAIKLRAGALEHKMRLEAHALHGPGAKGVVECWQKHSRPRSPGDDRRPSIPVYKRRRSAWFAELGGQLVAIPPTPRGSSICIVELAALHVGRTSSWSICLKATEGNAALVERVLEIVLRSFPARVLLVPSHCESFPASLLHGALCGRSGSSPVSSWEGQGEGNGTAGRNATSGR